MSEMYYSSDTEAKKQELAEHFEGISTALDKINEVVVADVWKCVNADDLDGKFEDLKAKIKTIKDAMTSYETFLDVAKKTYSDTSDEIDSVISSYVNEGEQGDLI